MALRDCVWLGLMVPVMVGEPLGVPEMLGVSVGVGLCVSVSDAVWL